jgi:hypothetical protein
MATENQVHSEVEKCRGVLEGVAKNVADRLYGPHGPPLGTSFENLERTALLLGRVVQKHFLDLALARQATAFAPVKPDPSSPSRPALLCPSCGRDGLPRDPEPRILHSRAGEAEWLEPQLYCPKCRKAFFPQSKSLGLDLGHYSSALLDLICYAGANKISFREASLDLDKLGGVSVQEKQVERLSKRIGAERLVERDAQVACFVDLPLAERCDGVPAGVVGPSKEQVAVVMADAGMLQLRPSAVPASESNALPSPTDSANALDAQQGTIENAPGQDKVAVDQDAEDDDPDQDKPPTGRHWHEDKVGLVLTMRSAVHENDPCPFVPETFLDADRVAKIVRGLKKSATLSAEDEAEAGAGEEAASKEVASEESASKEAASKEAVGEEPEAAPEYEGPKLEKRQVVATRKSWPLFGPILATAAWLAGFAKAERKAFVADGARAIWGVWRARFSSYVPVLDFIHAMSYVYAAAKAVGESPTAGWNLYAEWITWVWQGKVSRVIEKLQEWQKEHGKPAKGEAKTSTASVVARVLGYLQNNKDKMKYDEYRKQGLPIVSSLVESMVKQISRRVKGTEKFWGEEGAEAILQLRADYLSDGEVMEQFWQRRQSAASGQRPYRASH